MRFDAIAAVWPISHGENSLLSQFALDASAGSFDSARLASLTALRSG